MLIITKRYIHTAMRQVDNANARRTKYGCIWKTKWAKNLLIAPYFLVMEIKAFPTDIKVSFKME